ncbi:MAG TPA: hypothetical protein VHC68_00740 [Candidatus Paceibacterota bacterium]|nr:hypothetical protein [Candidatus Paceibacterota bacterium]
MGIFRALGFAIFLITLALLLPAVFSELSQTLVVFLENSQTALTAAGDIASHASSSSFSAPTPAFSPPAAP